MPHNHAKALATFPTSTPELAQEAIEAALGAQAEWETMPFNDRAAIFLRVRFSPNSSSLFDRNLTFFAFSCTGRRPYCRQVPRQDLRCYHARSG